jgi:hypothetical protein
VSIVILFAGLVLGLAATGTLYWWTLNYIFRIPDRDIWEDEQC